MNKAVLLLKVITTIGLWLYFFPEILNPNNVPFRFLLNIFRDDIGGTFFKLHDFLFWICSLFFLRSIHVT